MDEFLHHVVAAVCGMDPQVGSEWYELLGRSTPSPDDPEWSALVERLTQIAADAGVHTEGLMDILAQHDPTELQAAIAAVVWPEAADTPADAAAGEANGEAAGVAEDQAVWNNYLLTNGPSWNGMDESWTAFVEWFVYHADEQGVGGSARSFCAYAEASGARAVFAQYGVTLNIAESAAAAEGGMSVEQVVAEYGPALYAEFREANPDLADMSDDDLAIVLAEALTGQAELAALGTE